MSRGESRKNEIIAVLRNARDSVLDMPPSITRRGLAYRVMNLLSLVRAAEVKSLRPIRWVSMSEAEKALLADQHRELAAASTRNRKWRKKKEEQEVL